MSFYPYNAKWAQVHKDLFLLISLLIKYKNLCHWRSKNYPFRHKNYPCDNSFMISLIGFELVLWPIRQKISPVYERISANMQ